MNKSLTIPENGIPAADLLNQMQGERHNDLKWQEGKSFCLIYYPGEEKLKLIQDAYNLFFTENAVNPMAFPSLKKFETEVIAMVANLLHGNESVTGTLTSGGTESILMTAKAARDYALSVKKISAPEIILPVSAHPAFHKACHYFNIKPVVVPIDQSFRVDTGAVEKTINSNTIMLVGSAPAYPHGKIDPIEALSAIALKHDLLLHIDACVGGMFLPFMEKLGKAVQPFDFRVPGITSISVDLHKFGYTAKGASVILYRNNDLRRAQFYIYSGWPGGIYATSAITGTRPGGAIAAAWAALNGIGLEGFKEMTRIALDVTDKIKAGICAIRGLKLLAEPDMSILAFTSTEADIFEIADELNRLGWHFERLQSPPAMHITVSQIHTISADAFLKDLETARAKAKQAGLKRFRTKLQVGALKTLSKILPGGMIAGMESKFSSGNSVPKADSAAVYGMMGALAGTEDLDKIVLNYMDRIYR